MKAIGVNIVQKTEGKKEAERNGYIDKANKSLRNIGKGDFVLFIELDDKDGKKQWNDKQ